MKKIVVFTAIFGPHDTLKKQPKQTVPCKYICFTDQKNLLIEKWAEEQREIILKPNKKEYCDRMNAKRYRTHPFDYIDASTYFYMDGTGRLLNDKSVEYFVRQLLPKSDILAYQHCERDCIYDEAMFSQYQHKYKRLPIREQVMSYKKEWMPEHRGLSATGLLVFKKSDKIAEFLHRRRAECVDWTYQDQLSFDYLVWKHNIKRQRVSWEHWTLRQNKVIDFKSPHLHIN